MAYTKQETDAYIKIRGRIIGTRIFLAIIIGLVFVILKSFGALTWSWWWVTAPLWGSIAYFIVAVLGIFTFGAAVFISQPKQPSLAATAAKLTAVPDTAPRKAP